MSIGTSTVSHPSGEARAEARRHPQITNAHRGGELPRRHLPFERFGGVTDERSGDLYVINHGEVDVGSDNIAAYFIGGAAVPRARGRLSAARQLADSLLVPGARSGRGLEARPYHLPHTFATEALAAGVSTFELSRVMGTSLGMIDRHYGHLARDSEDSIRTRLNARSNRSGVYLASEGD